MDEENSVAFVSSAALASVVVPEPSPLLVISPLTSPIASPIASPRKSLAVKRHFSETDPFLPFWVYEDEFLVSVWYLRLPTSTNFVTASDYSIVFSWEIPSPSEKVFLKSNLPLSVFYRDLGSKSGQFRISTKGQIQQDQGKWRREAIDDSWVYFEIPKITSISEKVFRF